MTFSIVARCERTGQLGVGAITAMVAVGKLVPHARARIGAIATQAATNPYLAYDGLDLLEGGASAGEACDELVRRDPGRDARQVAIVDASGGAAAWTGRVTRPWSGHRTAPGVSVQGNRLLGPAVLDAMLATFTSTPDLELAERIMRTLESGRDAGGDRQRESSAAVLVVDTERYPLWDVRVDQDEDPVPALRELVDTVGAELLPVVRRLPTREDPVGGIGREMLGELGEDGDGGDGDRAADERG